jgi:isoleucyl-tRNA synthetase
MPKTGSPTRFRPVDPKVTFPDLERSLRDWWTEAGNVARALASGDPAKPFVFFEGPPTANGRPGIHHVEARAVKDIIVRFNRMHGRRIIGDRAGWDTHGLPVEIQVERDLGFNGKPDIEKYGIAEFNKACKESVWRYIQEWAELTQAIAYWIDLDSPYVTYHNDYIESLWWILKRLWESDLLFRDYKVTMHCPRCGTSLSDHEVSMGFEDNVDDPSVWVRLRHRSTGHPLDNVLAGASMIAWTTTPWTLPANVALAVHPDARYLVVAHEGNLQEPERLVIAEDLAATVLGEGSFSVVASVRGAELEGVRYEALFEAVPAINDAETPDAAYRVVADSFVSLEDGTGIVHIAPAYGDLEMGRRHRLPTLFSVDLAGRTLQEFDSAGFGNRFFKEADPLIARNLRDRGLLFRSGRIRHSYPFCWRCKTPLLYYAKPSWYIRTTALKSRLVANNQSIRWVPEHIRDGRFGNWLESNVDWALSRERYWGTPLPIWVCDTCQCVEVIGSVEELVSRTDASVGDMDLHRPNIDALSWACPQCGLGQMRRTPDVTDAWFDSGAMPVAQWHYPFENQDLFAVAGQADYIAEAIDQTRGWFYTLHALSTLLFDRPAYRNVICLGLILDEKGEKMSKSRGNIVEPWGLIGKYGADATRWYMYASGPPYNPRRFSTEHVAEIVRSFLLTLWNTYVFFVTYANLDGWIPENTKFDDVAQALQPIDRWILAHLNSLNRAVTSDLAAYDVHRPAKRLEQFVDDLSNWYVRRNRRRFWKSEDDADKQAAYWTLYTCLGTLTRLLAPFVPFISEEMYRNLVAEHEASAPESVHLASWPAVDESLVDDRLVADTSLLLDVVSLGRAARRSAGIRIRQPLSEVLIRADAGAERLERFESELLDELNVKSVRYLHGTERVGTFRLRANLSVLGPKYGRLLPAIRQALQELDDTATLSAVDTLEAGQPISIEIGGEPLELEPGEVIIEAGSPEGYAVAEGSGLLVALNTVLTPELILQGDARDLIRVIQDARKSAGFAISDRIRVHIQPTAGLDLDDLLSRFGPTVQAETLAISLEAKAPEEVDRVVVAELEHATLTIGIQRVED